MAAFDPLYIIYQIISLQCFYYLVMGTVWGVFHAVFETHVSLDHFFTAKYLVLSTYSGWVNVLCTIFSAIIGSYLLYLVVEKSKKCVDFTFTLFFLHIVICTLYQQFPLEWEWWVLQVFSSVAMATVGEFLCARYELEDIPLYSNS